MRRVKFAAVLTVAIFLLSTFTFVGPVQAHFTLGNLTGTYRFHSLDFDPHVPGVVGYVWPGGGLNAYSGNPNFASAVLSPGYQSPYPCRLGGEPTGSPIVQPSSSCNPPGAISNSWYQLQGASYAPFGAILAGSSGDLIFALNATAGTNPGGCASGGTCTTTNPPTSYTPNDKLGWSGVTIFLPPGFTLPTMDGSNIVSTITNTYGGILVYKVSAYDRYAPGWTAVTIWTDGGSSAANNEATGTSTTSGTYYNHQFINFTSAGEWYYVRINGVMAPDVAGRYFFKVQLTGDSNYIAGQEGTATNSTASLPGEAPTQFIPTQNWPVLLVKGEIDPAIITGTIRYGGYNSTLYGQPLGEAGRVWAHMEDKIDPYTGQQITMCPAVGQAMVPGCTDAEGYWNATALGHYEVEGVAPGVYTIYAEAAGFPTTVIASGVTVLKGQSLHFDGYLQPGPVIHGNVFTKHQFGDQPWTWAGILPGEPEDSHSGSSDCRTTGTTEFDCQQYIKIEFYDAPTLSNIPDPSAHLVSWSPVPCVAGGQNVFFPKQHAASCGSPATASQTAFPWHEYTPCNGYLANGGTATVFGCVAGGKGFTLTQGYFQVSQAGDFIDNQGGSAADDGSTLMQDPQGVGPPQFWVVPSGTTTPFHFEFGKKAEYGAPRDLDGQVPQVYATWVNGLTPGRYYARAWTFRYVQTALDGATFQEYYFDITPQEWAGDVTLPIDLRLSSWVNKTVHFHDQPDSLIEDPINTGGGFMTGYLMGADGNIYSYNQTALGLQCTSLITPTTECGATFNAQVGPPSPSFGTTGCGVSGNIPGPAHTCYAAPGLGGWLFGEPAYGGVNGFPPGFGISAGSGVCLDPSTVGGACGDGTGVNSNAIQEGRANIQFWGIDDTWSGEDYGIPSGTYTPYTSVLGYNAQGPLEQVSVTLSGTVTSVSDHMIRGVGFNVTLFSIDWQRPTVNRAWEFGNPESWTFRNGIFGNLLSSSSRTGFINTNNVGVDIAIGAYSNNTLSDWLSDEASPILASSILASNLQQNQFENNVTSDGGGFAITSTAGNLFDANQSWFGSETKRVGEIGGFLGVNPFTGGGLAFLGDTTSFHNVNSLFQLPHYLEGTSFTPGQYSFGAYTYGYVQDQGFSVYADNTQIADVRLNLVIGVNITLDILFKKEHIITPTNFNMSGRIRLFNDQGQLVGEWMSSQGTYTPGNGTLGETHVTAADGTAQFPFGALQAVVPQPRSLNEYNFIPGGTTLLHATIAGLPSQVEQQNPRGLPQGGMTGDPIFTSACDFEIDCYFLPGSGYMSYPFPNTGISGYPDYQGGWTAEVDFVPWYNNNTNTPEAASFGGGSTSWQTRTGPSGTGIDGQFPQYFAPVNGLLLGESYHIIPGTTATSGISLTEDAALSSTFLGHSMVMNHLGPYSQEGVWQISGTHLSGEASGIFEVDLNGFISGTALAFTWANDFRPLSWATVSVTGASGATWNYYTYDGQYQMYLPSGTYSLTIASPGHASQTLSVAVTGGESGTAGNVYMQQSNIPVPEFSGIAIIAFAALAASVYVLRRRRR